MGTYFVYIVASLARVIYIGVTSDLPRRIVEHRTGAVAGFTRRYRVNRLVYYEAGENILAVIEREKELKGWSRRKKAELIEAENPGWEDLAVHLGLGVQD